MANFIPLKNYMFFCLDKMIAEYKFEPPFLDVGCGVGDISRYIAKKGWQGSAIDFSDKAVAQAKINLADFTEISVAKKTLFEENGKYRTIFIWDVLEHIEDDAGALRKISELLLPGGHLVIAVPSNPREWRWDDDFYGHFRRYSEEDLRKKIESAGLKPVECFDFTFPVFWLMRWIYTRLKRRPAGIGDDKIKNTGESAMRNAFDILVISRLISGMNFLWKSAYWMQFKFFRRRINFGHEFFYVAKK